MKVNTQKVSGQRGAGQDRTDWSLLAFGMRGGLVLVLNLALFASVGCGSDDDDTSNDASTNDASTNDASTNDASPDGGSRSMATLAATDATAAEASSDPGTFTITLANVTAAKTVIPYTLEGSATGSEGAMASGDDDYVLSATGATLARDTTSPATKGTLTIAAGDITSGAATVTLTVTPVDDSTDEDHETVILSLSTTTTPSGIRIVGSPQTVTITDDDNPAPPPIATLAVTDSTVAEESSDTGIFTITLANVTAAETVIPYTLSGTATGSTSNTASGADDYAITTSNTNVMLSRTNATSGTVTIAAAGITNGAATVALTITPQDDSTGERDETIQLSLGTPTTPSGITVASAFRILTITDNDPSATLALTDGTAAELNSETGSFTITLANVMAAETVISYTLGGTAMGSSSATASGTEDYAITTSPAAVMLSRTDAMSGTVTIPVASITNGTATVTLTITPQDDLIDDDDETVILTLSTSTTPIGIDILGSPQTVTITDDD